MTWFFFVTMIYFDQVMVYEGKWGFPNQGTCEAYRSQILSRLGLVQSAGFTISECSNEIIKR